MKVFAPRLPTPAPLESGRITSRLPDDIVADQVQRLSILGLISGVLWTIGLFMDWVVFPQTLGTTYPILAFWVDLSAAALGFLVYFLARHSRMAAHVKADAGLYLMVINAGAIALLDTWVVNPGVGSGWNLTWDSVAILISAMVVTSTPRKMLIAVLVAASLRPLGMFLAYVRGENIPPLAMLVAMSIPGYVCAVAATLPSRLYQRMGQRLKEARELGSYELVEKLGQGGMGEVWRARHRLLARDAAIKLVRAEMIGASNDGLARQVLRRFEREAQATALLNSAHSIRLFDFGISDEGCFYYVMELLNGRDLESFVRQFGALSPGRTMYLLEQACHSLAEAHARGLIHRDIKPANLFVCRMGLDYDFVKVLDFGLVKHFDAGQPQSGDSTQSLVTQHQLVGTPAYMAPEVILSGGQADQRSDVYALGCVAYFLLTGRRVFDEGTSMRSLIDHVHTAPPPPSTRTAWPISPEVDALVLACLAKDPENRPQDARELRQRIIAAGVARDWTSAHAMAWWTEYLPDLSAPLALEESPA